MKNDPRFAELAPGKAEASDMPARRPAAPARPVAPPSQSLTLEDIQPARRKRLSIGGFLGNGKWALACGVCALIGSLLGAVLTQNTTQVRIDRSQQRQLFAQSLDRLVAVGADVQGDISLSPTKEAYSFSRVNFSDVPSTRDMRKAVRVAATLPGVMQLSFFNPLEPNTSSGIADESVMAAVAANFPALDTLDVTATRISSFQSLEGRNIRHLKIVNTPLILESFTSLKFINGVSELSIGWPDRTLPKDHMLRTELFRKTLIEAISTMIDLKKINLYDFNLDKEDREKWAKFEIVTARLGQ
jgi:hypothetical protein